MTTYYVTLAVTVPPVEGEDAPTAQAVANAINAALDETPWTGNDWGEWEVGAATASREGDLS